MRLLGMYVLALQVQGAAASDAAGGQDVFALVARSSPIAKLVLLVLILFSITSWGIILFKLWALNRAERQSTAFLDIFRRSSVPSANARSSTHQLLPTLGALIRFMVSPTALLCTS